MILGGREARSLPARRAPAVPRKRDSRRFSSGRFGELIIRAQAWGLKEIPMEILEKIMAKVIVLSNNQIKILPPEILNWKALKILRLDKNQIQNVPKEIGELSYLEELSLTDNLIQNIPADVGALLRLKKISLSGNPLMEPLTGCNTPLWLIWYGRDAGPLPADEKSCKERPVGWQETTLIVHDRTRTIIKTLRQALPPDVLSRVQTALRGMRMRRALYGLRMAINFADGSAIYDMLEKAAETGVPSGDPSYKLAVESLKICTTLKAAVEQAEMKGLQRAMKSWKEFRLKLVHCQPEWLLLKHRPQEDGPDYDRAAKLLRTLKLREINKGFHRVQKQLQQGKGLMGIRPKSGIDHFVRKGRFFIDRDYGSDPESGRVQYGRRIDFSKLKGVARLTADLKQSRMCTVCDDYCIQLEDQQSRRSPEGQRAYERWLYQKNKEEKTKKAQLHNDQIMEIRDKELATISRIVQTFVNQEKEDGWPSRTPVAFPPGTFALPKDHLDEVKRTYTMVSRKNGVVVLPSISKGRRIKTKSQTSIRKKALVGGGRGGGRPSKRYPRPLQRSKPSTIPTPFGFNNWAPYKPGHFKPKIIPRSIKPLNEVRPRDSLTELPARSHNDSTHSKGEGVMHPPSLVEGELGEQGELSVLNKEKRKKRRCRKKQIEVEDRFLETEVQKKEEQKKYLLQQEILLRNGDRAGQDEGIASPLTKEDPVLDMHASATDGRPQRQEAAAEAKKLQKDIHEIYQVQTPLSARQKRGTVLQREKEPLSHISPNHSNNPRNEDNDAGNKGMQAVRSYASPEPSVDLGLVGAANGSIEHQAQKAQTPFTPANRSNDNQGVLHQLPAGQITAAAEQGGPQESGPSPRASQPDEEKQVTPTEGATWEPMGGSMASGGSLEKNPTGGGNQGPTQSTERDGQGLGMEPDSAKLDTALDAEKIGSNTDPRTSGSNETGHSELTGPKTRSADKVVNDKLEGAGGRYSARGAGARGDLKQSAPGWNASASIGKHPNSSKIDERGHRRTGGGFVLNNRSHVPGCDDFFAGVKSIGGVEEVEQEGELDVKKKMRRRKKKQVEVEEKILQSEVGNGEERENYLLQHEVRLQGGGGTGPPSERREPEPDNPVAINVEDDAYQNKSKLSQKNISRKDVGLHDDGQVPRLDHHVPTAEGANNEKPIVQSIGGRANLKNKSPDMDQKTPIQRGNAESVPSDGTSQQPTSGSMTSGRPISKQSKGETSQEPIRKAERDGKSKKKELERAEVNQLSDGGDCCPAGAAAEKKSKKSKKLGFIHSSDPGRHEKGGFGNEQSLAKIGLNKDNESDQVRGVGKLNTAARRKSSSKKQIFGDSAPNVMPESGDGHVHGIDSGSATIDSPLHNFGSGRGIIQESPTTSPSADLGYLGPRVNFVSQSPEKTAVGSKKRGFADQGEEGSGTRDASFEGSRKAGEKYDLIGKDPSEANPEGRNAGLQGSEAAKECELSSGTTPSKESVGGDRTRRPKGVGSRITTETTKPAAKSLGDAKRESAKSVAKPARFSNEKPPRRGSKKVGKENKRDPDSVGHNEALGASNSSAAPKNTANKAAQGSPLLGAGENEMNSKAGLILCNESSIKIEHGLDMESGGQLAHAVADGVVAALGSDINPTKAFGADSRGSLGSKESKACLVRSGNNTEGTSASTSVAGVDALAKNAGAELSTGKEAAGRLEVAQGFVEIQGEGGMTTDEARSIILESESEAQGIAVGRGMGMLSGQESEVEEYGELTDGKILSVEAVEQVEGAQFIRLVQEVKAAHGTMNQSNGAATQGGMASGVTWGNAVSRIVDEGVIERAHIVEGDTQIETVTRGNDTVAKISKPVTIVKSFHNVQVKEKVVKRLLEISGSESESVSGSETDSSSS